MARVEEILIKYQVDIQNLVKGVDSLKGEMQQLQKNQDETLNKLQDKIDESTKKINGMNTTLKRASAVIVAEIGIAAARAFGRFADDIKKAAFETEKLKKEGEKLSGAYQDLTRIIGTKLAPAFANKLLPILTDITNAINQIILTGRIWGKTFDEDVASNVKNVADRLEALEKRGDSARQRLNLLNDVIARQTKLITEGSTELIRARARATVSELTQLGRTLGLLGEEIEEDPLLPLQERLEEFTDRKGGGLLKSVAIDLEFVKQKIKEVNEEALESEEDFGPLYDRLQEIQEATQLAGIAFTQFGVAFVEGAALVGTEGERLAQFQSKLLNFEKSVAQITIIIEQSKALAQGVEAATKAATVVGIIARIATITAAILGTFGSIKRLFSSAQQNPEVPAFSKGVIRLQGKGTGTSDSILARLSKGESVMTAEETEKHHSALMAMRKRKFDDYVMQDYLPKLASKNDNFADRIAKSMGLQNSGSRDLLRALKDGSRRADSNTDRLIKAIISNNKRRGW